MINPSLAYTAPAHLQEPTRTMASPRFNQDMKRVEELAFADRDRLAALLRFREQVLPRLARDSRKKRLAALFEHFVEMALQGGSVHPSDPVQLAEALQKQLQKRRATKLLGVLEQLLVAADLKPSSGNNALQFAHPERVVGHEHQRRTGSFEITYKDPIKYRSYQQRVRASQEFWDDWRLIKKQFTVSPYQDGKGIIRRSPNPEYNWRREETLQLAKAPTAFRVAFDFLCWKWFLWGMRRDEPLVEQLFYAITPYGTQIFIPGYWSLDAARDLHWDQIKRLHAARGIHKQGRKLESNRQQREQQLTALAAAQSAAARAGIRGAARYTFLKEAAGLVAQTDDAQVRRLLRNTARLQSRPAQP
jgi:hypothetical protein